MPLSKKISPDRRLEEVMIKDVIRVRPEMKLREVAELLIAKGISGAPVVDGVDRVLTVIGEGITLRLAATEGLEATVSHCLPKMTPAGTIITLTKEETVTDAYRAFLKHNIHRIPIIDGNGLLQGLITRSTILQMFVEAHHGKPIARKPPGAA